MADCNELSNCDKSPDAPGLRLCSASTKRVRVMQLVSIGELEDILEGTGWRVAYGIKQLSYKTQWKSVCPSQIVPGVTGKEREKKRKVLRRLSMETFNYPHRIPVYL